MTSFCGQVGHDGDRIHPKYPLEINSCYRESLLDGLFPLLFFIVSIGTFIKLKYIDSKPPIHISNVDYLRLPTAKTLSVFKTSLLLLVVTLIEISSWAFLFAWRLESAILDKNKVPSPLYQVIDPGLAFIPRIYILILVIKSFTTPSNPLDPSKFTRYSAHFQAFYTLIFLSSIVRLFDYYLTDNNWFISQTMEKTFAILDFGLCSILWLIIMTCSTELNQGELVDFEDDDDGVLVLHDGRVVRNGRILSLESSASPLSSLTFSWMNSLLKTAFKSKLTANSLWALPTRQRARENHRLFNETKKKFNHHTAIITIRSLAQQIYMANKKIVVYQFLTAIGAVLFHYANPFYLRKLLNFIQENHHPPQKYEGSNAGTMDDSQDLRVGYLYCVALFACNITSTLVASQTLLWGRRWHVTITHMLSSEIYSHALELNMSSNEVTGVRNKQNRDHSYYQQGEQDEEEEEELEEEEEESESDQENEENVHQKASLMSQDIERLAEWASCLHIFYTCPLEIAAGVIFLYQILGNSFLAGLIVMVVALPSTHYISKKLMLAQARLTDAKSWRIRLLRELCEGIKTIKFLASERRWEQAITNARNDELVKLIKLYTQNTILGLIWFATPVFVTTISFAWYTLVEKKTLDASTAFVSIVLFGMLRDPLNVMPQAIMAYNDAKMSLTHITTFLNTEQKQTTHQADSNIDQESYKEQVQTGFELESIFEWPLPPASEQQPHWDSQQQPSYRRGKGVNHPQPFKLTVPHLLFPTDKLSIISGASKCGKSSLLYALLGEMPLIEGNSPLLPSRFLTGKQQQQHHLTRDRHYPSFYLYKVAFVAQKPWIEHGTIRENILFSEPWDDARYRAVLHQCDLLRDLSFFDNGDLTLTNDHGISTSEIMQHKISLARAVYSNSKTVLIDDVFSMLGKLTSTFIYENCIRGELMKGRTIIVAAAYPDMFWARDTSLLVHLVADGRVDAIETNPETIVSYIKSRRSQKPMTVHQDSTIFHDDPTAMHPMLSSTTGDVIDLLYDPISNNSTGTNRQATVFDEDIEFDEASIIPNSIRQADEEDEIEEGEYYKSRDYAYSIYYAACGGWKYWTGAIIFTLLARLANISESYWLKVWSMAYSRYHTATATTLPEQTDIPSFFSNPNNYVLIYLGLCLVTVVCNFVRTVVQYRGSLRASNRLFLGLLQSVCHAPLQFFDLTPTHQIMSRFSKDMETVDSSIGWHVNFLLQTVFGVFGVVLTIGTILPEFFVAALIAAMLYFYIGRIYIRASRELKKLNSDSRPPIFQLYADTVAGLATVRAYSQQWNMTKKMLNRLDDHMRPFYTLWNTNRWLFVRVELLGTFLSLFIGVALVKKVGRVDAGLAGIALTFSTSLLEYVYWLMRQSTTVDMHFEAVERIHRFVEMPQEPPSVVEGSRPPAAWPTAAIVQVRDLMAGYSNSEADVVLKHISFNIFSGEKVALVGRPGAEKQALVSCLFRFMEPITGSIKIDGVNIAWIGVEDLRSRITFISKEGRLLSGTVRSNLDPFGEYDDYALWQVLYRVRLAKPTSASAMHHYHHHHHHDPSNGGSGENSGNSMSYNNNMNAATIQDLDKDIGKEGRRLSVLERQLLCVARALLQDCTKLVIIEEAHLNSESQEIIRSVINQEFEESTLIVIPYMLHEVVNYDKVMVFDQGNLVEFDSAIELLNKQNSLLQSLCEKAGILDNLTLDADVLT